eukprot:Skav225342  [mRNA]  locus=scaffold3721:30122:30862:+ [translate_table: standard]
MARSAYHDERLVAVCNAINLTCQKAAQAPAIPVADWIQFYGSGSVTSKLKQLKPCVGPIAVQHFEGRGLGLVATCKIDAGDVLLIENAFALSTTCNAPISKAMAELTGACCNKVESLATPLVEREAFWCLHSDDGDKSLKDIQVRTKAFQTYFAQLNSGTIEEESLGTDPSSHGGQKNREKIVASIVSSNSRKTEHWNPWTLLLDESESLGGLWLAASLFNHSCLGNVVVSYGSSKDACCGCQVPH